jgi:hypothetical protein
MVELIPVFFLVMLYIFGLYWFSKPKHENATSYVDGSDKQYHEFDAMAVEQSAAYWKKIYPDSQTELIEAHYYGNFTSPSPISGVLGIEGHSLIYMSPRGPLVQIVLSKIRWISHQKLSFSNLDDTPERQALTLHTELNGLWDVYVFSTPHAESFAREIQARSGANYSPGYLTIYGPIRVRVKNQDIYGQWQHERYVGLYLAPNYLLADWQSWIELRQIQHLALLPHNTLKITYLADKLYVIGLDLDHDRAIILGQRLERATGLTMEDLAGRKKKSQ